MAKKDKEDGDSPKKKVVVNTTPRVVNVAYKTARGTITTFQFMPGLNKVEKEILALLIKQSGFRKLFDKGRLSGAPGDVSMARDIQEAQRKGKDSKTIPPPEAPPNSRNVGAALTGSMSEAADGKDKTGKRKKGK